MVRQTLLLISDMRQVYLAEILTKKGLNVRCLDIRNSQTAKEQLEKLCDFLKETKILILPVPIAKIRDQQVLNEILNKNVRIQSHSTISKKTIRESIYDRIQLLLKGYKLLFLNKKINFIVFI